MAEIRRFENVQQLASAAGQLFVQRMGEALQARSVFDVALSGGNTPKIMHQWLAEHARHLGWSQARLWMGDERTVAPDHPDSNARMIRETLLDPLALGQAALHPMYVGGNPQEAAAAYQAQLSAAFGGQLPRFDLIFLGLGDDTHTASLFPYTAALREREKWVVANEVPKLSTTRITLTYPVINHARMVVFLVSGESKAQALRQVLRGESDVDAYPAQGIAPQDGQLLWMVDEPAYGLMDG